MDDEDDDEASGGDFNGFPSPNHFQSANSIAQSISSSFNSAQSSAASSPHHHQAPELGSAQAMPARIRQYNSTSIGPFVVIIRESTLKMRPMYFARYINTTYKSIESIKPSPGKMRVVLRKWQEANAVANDPTFSRYNTNIPADNVEVEGAINVNDLCDLDDMKELIDHGIGIFGNSAIPPCKILYAERITRPNPDPSSGNPPVRILTNTVKLIFTGQILPKFVVIEGLRVRIRPFHGKPMFCDNCQQFGHTNKYCRRSPKCAKCSENHSSSACTAVNPAASHPKCMYCRSAQPHDRNNCDYFCEVTEGYRKKQANRRKTRYQQAIATSTNGTAPLSTQNSLRTDDDSQFPVLENQYEHLPIEELQQPSSQNAVVSETISPASSHASRPTNPYAKVLRSTPRPIARARSASKRRKMDHIEYPQGSMRPTAQPATSLRPAKHTIPKTVTTSQSTTSSLITAIIAFARQANIPIVWLNLLESILEPLLQALLPQLPSLLIALQSSFNNQ